MNREAIYSALFARLSSLPGVKTASRKLKLWNDVPAGEQPAIFQAQKNEIGQARQGLPTLWTLSLDVYVYVKSPGKTVPATVLNPLLDAITDALKPDNPIQNTQTLGGLVAHCWIEGTIETDEGTLGDQAVAIVPIRILAA